MQQAPGQRVADSGGDVAERVRQVIAEAGCSQREFARRIVMDPSKLSRSLGGSRRFTAGELARIADAGAVDAGWLLGTGTSGAGASPEHAPAPASPDMEAPSPYGSPPQARATTAAPEGGRPLQIVRETVRLIAEHGYHAVRVSDIAEACATSTAAIHYHFPGRAELLEAAVRWCMDEDTVRRDEHIAEAGDAAGELRQLIEFQIPDTEQQRVQWMVWFDLWAEAARSTAIGQLHAHYYTVWRTTVADVLRRGIAQGVFRDVDPEFSALRLTALIDGLAAQVIASPCNMPSAGTSTEEMRTALLAYVETELAA
ncbi:TetR/AcrR family transcriptional regulator [Streptomyces sp. ODS28]|uniref:TetR/AcrR family transcriptional regulator n=1 Tax=Streptomyces sp. ODS28 TaxID=3136688 RepID=UPI0031EB85AC